MLTDRTLWQAAQVANRLGISPAAFAQRRRRLEDAHGFPPPVPGLCRRWNPAAIEAWLKRQQPPEYKITGEAADILIARARAMAAA